jgi:SSS family solute:Na+ symporter
VFWYGAYLLFAIFLVHRVHEHQAVTLPDLVGKMFGPRSAKLSAVFTFFNVLPIVYVISLGALLEAIFGWPTIPSMALGTLAVLLYSTWGGLRAVVFSDLLQFWVMCSGVLLVAVFSVAEFGGLAFLQERLPASHFDIAGEQGWPVTIAWGMIALGTLVDPNFYQRCFAASSARVAKRGILASTLIWAAFDICTTTGALYARALIPEAEPNQAYLSFAMQLLPDGVRGFVLAGITATILSTLDSYLFIAGTAVAYDLWPGAEGSRVRRHHLGMFTVGAIAVGLAVVFDGNIERVWKLFGSYFTACLLLPMLAGHVWRGKIHDHAFCFACVVGIVATTGWQVMERSGFWLHVDELYVGVLATGSALVAGTRLFRVERCAEPDSEV